MNIISYDLGVHFIEHGLPPKPALTDLVRKERQAEKQARRTLEGPPGPDQLQQKPQQHQQAPLNPQQPPKDGPNSAGDRPLFFSASTAFGRGFPRTKGRDGPGECLRNREERSTRVADVWCLCAHWNAHYAF